MFHHYWSQTNDLSEEVPQNTLLDPGTAMSFEDVGYSQGTRATRCSAHGTSRCAAFICMINSAIRKWDEQKTVKEAHSYSRQLCGFSVSPPLPSLWFLNLWVTPYRPTSCFLMNNLWVSIITVNSLCQLMTVACGHIWFPSMFISLWYNHTYLLLHVSATSDLWFTVNNWMLCLVA